MENTTSPKTNIAFTYGLIAGLIVVVITLLQYLGGINVYMGPLGFVSYLVLLTMAVLAALRTRKENEGFLEFREALKVTFTVLALALLLQTLFSWVLFNFIDVPFKQALNQEVMNKTEQMMNSMGAPQNTIDKALEDMRTTDQFGLGRILLGYAMMCIVAFIFALLISLIVKKNKPVFSNI